MALPQTGQGAETLIATYRELNAADMAHALQELPMKRRHEVAEAMDDERLADVLGELPEMWVDPDKFQQVVGNLVENALRHGEGTVTMKTSSGVCARPGPEACFVRLAESTRPPASAPLRSP